jgi:hypothetical protein
MKKSISTLLMLFIVVFSCKKPDPNIPGETKGNPLKATISDILAEKVKLDKTYVAVQGVALTGLYSYTYKKKKYSGAKIDESKANKFYFPIVTKTFNPSKDELTVFVSISPGDFKKITNELKDFMMTTSPEKTLHGSVSGKLPKEIVNAYTSASANIKVAQENKRIVIRYDRIE